MDQHRGEFRVVSMCRVLKVSRSGFYDWCSRAQSARAVEDRQLTERIRQIHERNRQAYGVIKIHRELRAQGCGCGRNRVARLKRMAGIQTKRRRRFRVCYEWQQMPVAVPNILNRQFKVTKPNRTWVADTTFITTRAGFLYLATLLDLYSRRVVGWAMGHQHTQQLVSQALEMAIEQRAPKPGLIHHSDQGRQYSAGLYQQNLAQRGLVPSMSRKGNCYDNACAESFFSTLKNELIHHCDFHTREQARSAIFDYIELFYNRQRLHASLGYVSPAQFEQRAGVS
jgi:putative transposase